MVSTVEKGDDLENRFYQYLLDQKSRGDRVYGSYDPSLCEIYLKRKYFCAESERDVQFDVVVELFGEGRIEPNSYVIFECKNYKGAIPETEITDFSDKLGRIFKHASKGVMVVSSRLQSGAEKLARKRKIGIAKYDEHGCDIILDRKGGTCAENRFIESQIFENLRPAKSLKFSAYHDGKFFSSIDQLLGSFFSSRFIDGDFAKASDSISVPYVGDDVLKDSAQKTLELIDYKSGPVDLEKICAVLSIDLQAVDQSVQDGEGNPILGSVNFDRKSILIYSHDDKNRERFTIGHEIGHFRLKHDNFLRSETIVESDLLISVEKENVFNFERLEIQANKFASYLLLPDLIFLITTDEYKKNLDIRDRGHGYIFVDDQPCNNGPYKQLLRDLSSYFEVSKQAIEIRLKNMGLLTDQRKKS